MNLKLHEVLSLYYELNGVTKQGQETEVLTQGMLKQKMSLKTKVYLQRLNKVVSEEVKLYEEAKQELWKKWGDEKDGMIEIPAEKVADFNKELRAHGGRGCVRHRNDVVVGDLEECLRGFAFVLRDL